MHELKESVSEKKGIKGVFLTVIAVAKVLVFLAVRAGLSKLVWLTRIFSFVQTVFENWKKIRFSGDWEERRIRTYFSSKVSILECFVCKMYPYYRLSLSSATTIGTVTFSSSRICFGRCVLRFIRFFEFLCLFFLSVRVCVSLCRITFLVIHSACSISRLLPSSFSVYSSQ